MKLAVLAAGLSEPSSTRLLADRLAAATATRLAAHDRAVQTQIIELRPLAHDVVDQVLTRVASPALAQARDTVQSADALIAVSPTFSMSYSGLFKSFMDTLDEGSLAGIPTLLGATGGTARHSMVLESAMRPLLSYFKTMTVPTAVYAASEDWGTAGLDGRIERAGTELADLMVGLPDRVHHDPFDADGAGFIPFEQMMQR
ncbi:MAG: CE1759 family FMN reductase [Beutenbergiaceae bacterium]